MNMLRFKLISIFLIFALLSAFTIFQVRIKSEKYIISVERPDIIQVDLNGNKIVDNGETICIPEIETFTSDLTKDQHDLVAKLKISNEDAIKLGYLTDNFAQNLLINKKAKVNFTGQTNQNCKFADITINNESYRTKLLNSGLGFYQGKPLFKEAYEKQLLKAKKLHLVILNHRSNKYHELNCKYGLVARDTIIIPVKQLSQEAKPCKFCHIDKKALKHQNKKQMMQIQTYPLAISTGSIKMYLTDLTTKLKPDKTCSSLACKELISQINQAQNSLYISTYGCDTIPEMHKAFLNAKARGVKIQVVYDTSIKNDYPDTKILVNLADTSATEAKSILMHNKFMIIDKSKVITGSMNFSTTDLSGFNSNCLFFINSKEIAQIYLEEFNQMLAGKFHNSKIPIKHKTVLLNNTKVTPFFSPKDKIITNNVIPMINQANKYIYIPAFIITHQDFADSLIKAKQRGVDIKLIIDATNYQASNSKVKTLRNAGIPVKIENYAGKVHSKSIIIDDKYIISGSMNFTLSGENKNDENVLIIEDERLARYYRGFFEYLWNKIPNRYLKQGVRAEGKYSIGSCSDGIDNNFDGKIDAEDVGCK